MFSNAQLFNQDIGGWNVSNVTDMSAMFNSAFDFDQDIGNWNVGNVTSMVSMFYNASVFNQDIGNWNVENVTNMTNLFNRASIFNQDIGLWNVSNVTNMTGMFQEARIFNQDIGGWNVGNVTTTSNMFNAANRFNQDIGSWNVSNVTNMRRMFIHAHDFNQDIGGWDVSSATTMEGMFAVAFDFNQDIGGWNVTNVTDMSSMFLGAPDFDQNLGTWNVINLTDADNMLNGPTLSLVNYDALLNGWNALVLQPNVNFDANNSQYCFSELARTNMISTSNWTITDAGLNCTMQGFVTTWKTDNPGPTGNNQIRIPTGPGTYNYTVDWGDGNTTTGAVGDVIHTYVTPGTYTVTITGIFPRIHFSGIGDRLKILSIEQWGDIAWESMQNAFYGCENLQGNFTDSPNLSNVTSTEYMFRDATIFNHPIGDWDVSDVTNMFGMFAQARAFNQNISNWDVSNVTNMGALFGRADDFNQNLNNWDVGNVTNMQYMFDQAFSFNQDIGNWNVSNVTQMADMFKDATSFDQDLGNWATSSLIGASDMFANVTLSTSNYDSLLIGWDLQNLNPNVNFSGGNSQYCAGEAARTNMISNDLWSISDGGNAAPTADILSDVTQCGSYTLPMLSIDNNYFTETNGGGSMLNAGDSITTSQEIFIFAGVIGCSDESSFLVTIDNPVAVDNLSNVEECENYLLPVLTNGRYYTQTGGTGTELFANDEITSSQEIFIYLETGTCSDEHSFNVTIGTPVTVDILNNVEECEIYTLPVLTNGRYFTETGGAGTELFANNSITTSQEIFIFLESGACSDESSFDVTINTSDPADNLSDVEDCESYVLPALATGRYFTETGGAGTELFANDIITTTQRIFIFSESGVCSNENSFNVIIDDILCGEPEIVCEVEFPKFITPNGDGINDSFGVLSATCQLNGELSIFDRYGKMIFQTSDLSRTWDGTFSGMDLPQSDYWYRFTDSDNGIKITKHFTLKR
jgi:gliding motility-associated-like protein